ncbi:interleukin-15 [Trichomycterus rosablanca]|uniref:interleukin-15 n=1 Tax=Trichomycterus rosablanca TaxID=2290929 RepID=UPI002F352124
MAPVDLASMSFFISVFLVLIAGFSNKRKRQKSKRSVRCFCVPWCFDRNLEYHLNLEVWNSFLIMSCLSALLTHVDAHHKDQSIQELQNALDNMTTEIKKSSATLYAPERNFTNCTSKIMYCYLLELNVVVMEENLNNSQMIYTLIKKYEEFQKCEASTPVNSTTFLKKMKTFLLGLMS